MLPENYALKIGVLSKNKIQILEETDRRSWAVMEVTIGHLKSGTLQL